MSTLIAADGTTYVDCKQILKKQAEFYEKLYQTDTEVSFHYINKDQVKVDPDDLTELNSDFTLGELTKALKSSKRGKSPGLDRLSTEFYVIFWLKLANPLLEVMNYAQEIGKLHKSALKGVIVTIPKKGKDTRYLKNLRPITLLNTDYKLIEKVISGLINPILIDLIHNDQKGFLPNRLISANIRCILDIIAHLDSEGEDGIVVSMDYEKCFDRIEKTAIIGSLNYFGFSEKMITLAKIFYNGTSACVFNNGFVSREFKVTRGIKQEAPNSPYYFLLCAEVLAILLRNNKVIEGFPMREFNKLFGQYADDMDLYCKNTTANLKEIDRVMLEFCNNTGLKINYDKMTVFHIGSAQHANAQVYTIKGMVIEKEKINTLGVWITKKKESIISVNYSEIINKANAILHNWQNRQLSLHGKVSVINSLIGSLFVYHMYVLPSIPESMVKKLKVICQEFIWNGRKPKISLAKLQCNKQCGGLGLVNFRIKDVALKSCWIKYIVNDPYLSAFAYTYLGAIESAIWKCNLLEADIKCTWVRDNFWRDVLVAWSHLNYTPETDVVNPGDQIIWYNSCIKINNKIFFWKKAFRKGLLFLKQLYNVEGKIRDQESLENEFGLDVMQCNSIYSAFPKVWKLKLRTSNSEITSESMYDKFIKIKKPVSYYYRELTKNTNMFFDCYIKWQTKLGSQLTYSGFIRCLTDINKLSNNSKMRSIQYRILNNSLILNDRLYLWKITSSEECTFCCSFKETVIHLFTECEHTRKIFDAITEIVLGYSENHFTTALTKEIILYNNVVKPVGCLFNFCILAAKTFIYSK